MNASHSFVLVLWRVYVGRIYSSIAKSLKFDWLMQVTWKRRAFVNQIRFSKRLCKPDSFVQMSPVLRYSMVRQTKSGKYSSSYLFLSLSGQVVYFHEDYYCTNFSHYLQILAKVLQNMCLKNFAQFAGKYLGRSLFLISQQPATFSMRDSDLDAFLRILGNCQEHHFYMAHWNSCFCVYGTSM